MSEPRLAFLVGAGRSGTTIFANSIGRHPQIAHFYEPYYLWEHLLRGRDDDVPGPGALSGSLKGYIRREFSLFARKAGKPTVLDKSPGHCFMVPFVHAVFPEAKWLHILRDGRAVTLSLHKEWKLRERMVKERSYRELARVLRRSWGEQPFWRFRLKMLLFELYRPGNPSAWLALNKAKFKGKAMMGPRFPGWEDALACHSTLQFNACQWRESVRHAQAGLSRIPAGQVLELRYEDFIHDPAGVMKKTVRFLGYECDGRFIERLPEIDSAPELKWKEELSREQLREIAPILTDDLIRLGYERQPDWADAHP